MPQLSNHRVAAQEQAMGGKASGSTPESIAEAAEQRLRRSRRKDENRKKDDEETANRLLEELRMKREASAASFEGKVYLVGGG